MQSALAVFSTQSLVLIALLEQDVINKAAILMGIKRAIVLFMIKVLILEYVLKF